VTHADRVPRRLLRLLIVLVCLVPAALLIYTLAAFGALLLAPRAEAPPAGVTIYACDNGVHTDLVLPVQAAGIDWRASFTPEAFKGPVAGFDHVGIGWGSRDFYLNTPTWADLDVAIAVKSVLWDETVIRVDYRPAPVAGENCGWWRVAEDTYRQVAAFVRDHLRLSQGRPVQAGPGYGDRDAFYVANGRYTIIETCNQWTGRALRLGGAPVAPWTPYSFLVLWHLPALSP
jgi:uncharacterized protein (TIGR02117 family)